MPLNFLEMEIFSSALETEWKTVYMKKTKVGFNQECPESHPFAFDLVNLINFRGPISFFSFKGRKCCVTYRERDISVDGVGDWVR